jgi:nitrite reductase (NADH) small subunit
MIIHMEQIENTTSKIDTVPPVRVCTLDELPIGLGRAFSIAGRTIAIFRTRKGKIHAVDNRCPHKNGPLAEGMLAGDAIVCPLHAFRYEMPSGECDQPGACSVKTYATELRGDDVYLHLDSA